MYGFDSSPDSLTPSTSYFVQKMFASNKGHTVLPVTSSSDFGPLYWVASKSDSKNYVKLANYGPDNQTVQISVPGTRTGRLEMLAGDQLESNYPQDVTVQAVNQNVFNAQGNYAVNMPAWAVTVLVVS